MTTDTTEAATPETDDQPMINAINDNGYQVPCVDIEYARKLERERDEAIRQRDETNRSSKYSCDYNYEQKLKAERERDEAREKAERYRLEANALMLKVMEGAK